MRRLVVLLLPVLSLTLLGDLPARGQASPTPPAGSAGGASVTLTLLGESPSNGIDQPLTFTVRATNGGTATLRQLSIVLTIFSPARSRSVYEESLTGDPNPPVFTLPFLQHGALSPGASRTFHVEQPLTIPTIGRESALYPLRIDLRSADEVLGTIRTPMIYLAEPPKVPLNLAWTFVLSDPLQFGPDDVLAPGPVEADIAPGGWIDRLVAALDGPHPVAADLALSPVLLSELKRMAGGYRHRGSDGAVTSVAPGTGGAADAARVLGALARIVALPSVEVTALPFGDAGVPATIQAGFRNLTALLRLGRDEVQAVVGGSPSTTIMRPPSSELDAPSLSQLVGRGETTMLVDTNFIPTPVGLPFSPPSLTRLTGSGRTATAMLPDEGAQTLTGAYPDDPALAAHAVLGELAARYFEFPGDAGRGAALLFPEHPGVPSGLFAPLIGLVAASPWLSTTSASGFLARVPISADQTAVPVPERIYPSFDPTYLATLRSAKAALAVYRVTVIGADDAESVMAEDLLVAQSGTFVSEPAAGLRYIGAVQGTIQRTYRGVIPPPNGFTITLPSRHGTLPLTVRNESPYAIHARIVLTADPSLEIEGGGTKDVTLPANGSLPLQFVVDAHTTGRFPMSVQVLTPTGEQITAASQIVVRSTAYDRVALVITIGAALFLALWWGRRFLPRRAS